MPCTCLLSPQPQEVLFEGIRFPPNLNTPSAVAKVLAQEAGQLKASQLKQAASFEGRGRDGSSRQIKEAMFLQRVREVSDQEKAVKLKWYYELRVKS